MGKFFTTSNLDIMPIEIATRLGSNNNVYHNYIGNDYKSFTLNTASGTTAVNVITGSPGYYITRIIVQIDPVCTIASAGMVSLNFGTTALGTVGNVRFYIPASAGAPTTATIAPVYETGSGFFFLSPNVADVATISLNTALTAGSIRVAFNYGYTSQLNLG